MSNSTVIKKEDRDFCIEGFSSGYPYIDYITAVPNVFFPKGAVVELMGLKSTAKTTLVLEVISRYRNSGGTKKVLYVDFESSIKKQVPYALSLGIDLSDESWFDYNQPDTMQQGGDLILKKLRPNKKTKKTEQFDYAMIVVDTVASMRPAQEVENKFGDTKQAGLRGKLMAELLRNITADLDSDEGPAIIFINQVFEEISINKGPAAAFLPRSFDSSASNALKFYAVLRVLLTLKAKVEKKIINPHTFEEDKSFVGSVIEAKAEKNKVGVPFRTTRFFVRFGFGIDPIPTMIAAAIKKQVEYPAVKVSGKNSIFAYHIKDGKYSDNVAGLEKFTQKIRDSEEAMVCIASQLSQDWLSSVQGCAKIFNKTSAVTESGVSKENEIKDDKDIL